MFDKTLRKTIGSRTRARRKELDLTQDYLAERLDVNKSTIQRYESGTIDNTKKLVVEGLASALRVSPEYLRGETDSYETEIKDKKSLQIQDALDKAKATIPLGVSPADNDFAENMLLLILAEYIDFTKSFSYACQKYTSESTIDDELSKTIGLDSGSEFNQMLFLREITHTVNTFYELSELLRDYAHDPGNAQRRIKNMLRDHNV